MEYDFISSLAPNTYFDRHFNCEAVKILPGEYFVTQRDLVIVTVLGSCVSVCLRDHVSGIGGMNHFMLPGNNDGGISPISASARYGVYAMELLINHLLKLGARRNCFEAKVFGGGSVLRGMTANNIGDRNVEFVRDYLHTEHIPVVAEDLLDIYPRKVCFFPVTGKAMVKRLAHAHPEELVAQEKRGNAATVAQTTAGGSVDLF